MKISRATCLDHARLPGSGQANNTVDGYDTGMMFACGLDALLRVENNTSLNETFSAFSHNLMPS